MNIDSETPRKEKHQDNKQNWTLNSRRFVMDRCDVWFWHSLVVCHDLEHWYSNITLPNSRRLYIFITDGEVLLFEEEVDNLSKDLRPIDVSEGE